VNEQLDSREYEFLGKLLANPADQNHSYNTDLQALINDFPQSGILRAMLVANGGRESLKHAAVYFDPHILHKLATAPDSLHPVITTQIIQDVAETQEYEEDATYNTFSEQTETADVYTYSDPEQESAIDKADDIITAQETVTDTLPEHEHIAIEEEDAAPLMDELITEEKENTTHKPAIAENTAAREYEEYMAKSSEPLYTFDRDEYFHQDIEDDIYDEIVGIEDIGLDQLNVPGKNLAAEEIAATTGEPTENNTKENSYFVFDSPVEESNNSNKSNGQPARIGNEDVTGAENTNNEVSRYDDEKMPYTFRWWLDKTRKEHAVVYQPYVSNKSAVFKPKKQEIADELQQQYYESIISLNSVDELDQLAPKIDKAQPQPERKEDKIIERFIQEEPQIKHPSGIKLDNENKAKKSSEDIDELVTETLARIYTEQMLYHKAISTYKKLMLKFPEKSVYFAGQIELLENKIN
jgi:hypothetical protein